MRSLLLAALALSTCASCQSGRHGPSLPRGPLELPDLIIESVEVGDPVRLDDQNNYRLPLQIRIKNVAEDLNADPPTGGLVSSGYRVAGGIGYIRPDIPLSADPVGYGSIGSEFRFVVPTGGPFLEVLMKPAPGNAGTLKPNAFFTNSWDGRPMYIHIAVDSENTVPERDETNNIYTVGFFTPKNPVPPIIGGTLHR